jgi:hypothetical protein
MLLIVPDNSTPSHHCNQLEFKMFAFTRFRTWLSNKPLQQYLLGMAMFVGVQNPLYAATPDHLGVEARHHLQIGRAHV